MTIEYAIQFTIWSNANYDQVIVKVPGRNETEFSKNLLKELKTYLSPYMEGEVSWNHLGVKLAEGWTRLPNHVSQEYIDRAFNDLVIRITQATARASRELLSETLDYKYKISECGHL